MSNTPAPSTPAHTGAAAIILGRAGSKGVPGKNLAPVAGKPCAQWTIEHALHSRAVSTVALSSDSPELRNLGASLGAIPIHRPDELAGDHATIDAAARHAAEHLLRTNSITPSTPLVILYANVPVRPADLADRAIARLVETGCDSVQSYAPVGKHHPWWTARIDETAGTVRPWEGETLNHCIFRRQDLPPAFIPDGGIIALTLPALMLAIPGVPPGPHAFFGLDRRGITNPEGAVVDIDTPTDLLVADAILRGADQHLVRRV
ncbi:MAG: acylneuraminate cytidylyltransferase family protein [Phycisphaeraceae bacterium]|nr:acylneuraminate cytidylyltransferase family protein [Phycisphaeraceae bacterium]MCW5768472.1 acylneuraminate cytidylyltransferase family protein [Phycisphaeraceae bacterium]